MTTPTTAPAAPIVTAPAEAAVFAQATVEVQIRHVIIAVKQIVAAVFNCLVMIAVNSQPCAYVVVMSQIVTVFSFILANFVVK